LTIYALVYLLDFRYVALFRNQSAFMSTEAENKAKFRLFTHVTIRGGLGEISEWGFSLNPMYDILVRGESTLFEVRFSTA